MRENLSKSVRATLAAAGLLFGLGGAARAAVVDTYDRANTTNLGTTEAGGYTYLERHTSIVPPSGLRDIAVILDNRLVITGQQSTDPAVAPNPAVYAKAPGLVYLNGYDSSDVAISMNVAFENQINAPDGDDQSASSVGVLFRFAPNSTFTTAVNQPAQAGVLGAEILPNGDVMIREYNPANTGTNGLTSIYAFNPFKNAANNWRAVAGSLGTTFGGQPFDVNDNGLLELGEDFDLSMTLAGNTISMFINGQLLVSRDTLAFTGGAGSADGVGVYKNLISSAAAFNNPANVRVDDLNVSPIPEPAAVSLLAAGALLALRRRRAGREPKSRRTV